MEPVPTPWAIFRYQLSRAFHAANGTFDTANAWAWLLGYAALWAALAGLGYSMIEPNGPAGILLLGACCLGIAWFVVFLWRFLIVSPWHLHHEVAAQLKSSTDREEELELRRREVSAREIHNAALTAQIQQEDERRREARNDARLKELRDRFNAPMEVAPDAHLSLVWRANMLLLEIRNDGIDAVFDVRVDLSGAEVPSRDKGLFPAVWLNSYEADTRRIPETVSDWIIAYEIAESFPLYSAYFRYHLGGTIHSPKATYSWAVMAQPPVPPRPHTIKMVVSANPRLKGGPKTIEFEVCGRDIHIISGEVQPPR